MSKGRFARIRRLLDALLDADPADPAAWLLGHYPQDADIHAAVLAAGDETRMEAPQPPATRYFAEAGPRAPAFDAQALLGADIADRFALHEILGSGGSGTVFRAEDRITGETMAVKVFHASALGGVVDPRREAATLRLLRLPGVVALHEDGIDAVGPYLVMDLVEGRPFPGAEGPLSWDALRSLALALLDVLGRIHWAGMVHGDLKPSNVLVDGEGRPHVLDLGIARALDDVEVRPLAGTPRYLAPELLMGGHPDVRSDLFAVGVLLADALGWSNGQPPAGHDAPESVVHTVNALLSRDPDARPGSVAEALAGLRGGVASRHAVARARLAPLATLGDDAARRELAATLFAGPERWFHIPSDGAQQLLTEAAAEPDAVLERLDAWERAGFGRWEGALFEIDRAGLQRAKWAWFSTPRPAVATEARPATKDALRLLVLAYLSPVDLDDSTAGAVLGVDPDAARQARVELARGPWLPGTTGADARVWHLPPEARAHVEREGAELRARLADQLPAGDALRLVLLSAPEHVGRVPKVAVDVATHAFDVLSDGDLALWACEAGLRALSRSGDARALPQLVELLLAATMLAPTLPAINALRRRMGMLPPEPAVQFVERLARAVDRAVHADYAHALEGAPEILEAPTVLLRRLVASVRLMVARRSAPVLDEEQRKLEAAIQAGHEELLPYALSTRAWQAHIAGNHAEEATLHRRLTGIKASPVARLRTWEALSSALLDAGDLEGAREAIEAGAVLARDLRQPQFEAAHHEQLRHIACRSREPVGPDVDSVEFARHFGSRLEAASLASIEAEIAWRAGEFAIARQLADAALDAHPARRLLSWLYPMRALQALLPPGVPDDVLEQLVSEVLAHPEARVVVCAGALLARVPNAPREKLMEQVRLRAPEIRAPHDMPLHVISVSEALQGW
ncbi:MAG: serine/threonine-protein kinase [Planctomycetota bacterium]